MNFPRSTATLSFLLFAIICGCTQVSAAALSPRVFLWDANALNAAQASLAGGAPQLQPALERLREDAERVLKARPGSVMDKKLTAASGDKHDYFSFGPYWWPDPNKRGGLPYIQLDGKINPSARVGTDDEAFGKMCGAIETLGLAYWFTHDERYARQAARIVRVWFLDPATRMNPNFQHAQAIPGVVDGRGIGLIEARRLVEVNEGLALLGDTPEWTTAERRAYVAWLESFYQWITKSPHAKDERNELNNHGTWCDYTVSHLALVLNHSADAKQILTEGLARRLAHQVEPSGAQPLELARTNSLNYSLFNLEALFGCAQLAQQVGVDWWGFTTPDGRSLHAALAYLAPYADPTKTWQKEDLRAANRNRLIPLLDAYLRHGSDPMLSRILENFAATSEAEAQWRLIANRPLTAAPAAPSKATPVDTETSATTPLSLPGSEPHIFRKIGDSELRLHAVKPKGWSATDRRACLVSFFGGGWNNGTPESSITWAKWAAAQGLVGIAPDYRTRNRWGGTPEDCVSDGREAMRWIAAHADELGIDPTKLVVLGSSAGGHVAAWTAIPTKGPGKDDPATSVIPAALILLNPVTDTKAGGYGGPKRFGGSVPRALALSVPDQMPAKMPPTLIFHATGDKTVPYANSSTFCDKLVGQGNRCELITFEGLGHSYFSAKYGPAGKAARAKSEKTATAFLVSLGLITTEAAPK